MHELGAHLRMARNKCKFSLKEVYKKTGITDSKLSKIERGKGKMPDPAELKILAKIYNISLVQLYVAAGYLEKKDFLDYQTTAFDNASLLNEEELKCIQNLINLLLKRKREYNHDF